MSWRDFVMGVAGTNQSEIARQIGSTPSTISRWFKGATPDARLVIAFADHYGIDRTEALIRAANLDDTDTRDLLKRLGRDDKPQRTSRSTKK